MAWWAEPKGNCRGFNSVMERFFLSLKMERVWQRDDANPRRSHS
jgi:transposase InsO family protein